MQSMKKTKNNLQHSLILVCPKKYEKVTKSKFAINWAKEEKAVESFPTQKVSRQN